MACLCLPHIHPSQSICEDYTTHSCSDGHTEYNTIWEHGMLIIPGWFHKYITSVLYDWLEVPEWLVSTWSWCWDDTCAQLKPPRERHGQVEQSSKGLEQVSSYPSQQGSGALLQEKILVITVINCIFFGIWLVALVLSWSSKNVCRRQS